MTNTIAISCIINTTNPTAKLGFEAWVDDTKFYDIDHVTEQQKILIEIPEDDAAHELRLVLKNKTDADTKIAEDGTIISDATLTINDLAFDEVQLGYMLADLAVYTHNFNGNGETIQDKFYQDMGCNGVLSLKFSTPIYLWLLEHM